MSVCEVWWPIKNSLGTLLLFDQHRESALKIQKSAYVPKPLVQHTTHQEEERCCSY